MQKYTSSQNNAVWSVFCKRANQNILASLIVSKCNSSAGSVHLIEVTLDMLHGLFLSVAPIKILLADRTLDLIIHVIFYMICNSIVITSFEWDWAEWAKSQTF